MTKQYASAIVFISAILFTAGHSSATNELIFGTAVSEERPNITPAEQVVFVGDVMMARKVEWFMAQYGSDYPFRHTAIKEPGTVMFANFESAVAPQHKRTPDFTFKFSTDVRHLPALRDAGVTHVSLANNHALDYGDSGYEHTKVALGSNDIVPLGSPWEVSTSSVEYLELNGYRIGVIALHSLDGALSFESLTGLMREVETQTDLQIIYIHWGSEYILEPSNLQVAQAKVLVNEGADLIIGHHPHVVQDIGYIDGVPVFYSLGNHVFDQYFSQSVQEGLMLSLVPEGNGLTLRLVVTSSIGSPSSPRVMGIEEQGSYLARLAARSHPELGDMIRQGQIRLTE